MKRLCLISSKERVARTRAASWARRPDGKPDPCPTTTSGRDDGLAIPADPLRWDSQVGRRFIAGQQSAFTLTEMMMTSAIFLFVLSGLITSYMYGLRMFEITKPKLSASDDARETIGKLVDEIRSAKLVRIGSGDMNHFTEVGVNSAQAGSAIQIYPTVSTNNFTRYFWDASEQTLKRIESGAAKYSVMARAVTNQQVFTAEDFAGHVHTNNMNNRVIGLNLQFNQIQYPVMAVGPGNYYDFYQLRTKITRRTLF